MDDTNREEFHQTEAGGASRGLGIKDRIARVQAENAAAVAAALGKAKEINDPIQRDAFLQQNIEELKELGRHEEALPFARLLSDARVREAVQATLYAADMNSVRLRPRWQNNEAFALEVKKRKENALALDDKDEAARAYVAIAYAERAGHGWLEDAAQTLREAAKHFPNSAVVQAAYLDYIQACMLGREFKQGLKIAEIAITDQKERDALYASFVTSGRDQSQIKKLLELMSEPARVEAALAYTRAFAFSKEKKHFDLGALAHSAGLIPDAQKRVDLIRDAAAGYTSRIEEYDVRHLKNVGEMVPGEKAQHELFTAIGSNVGNLFTHDQNLHVFPDDYKALETIASWMKNDAQNVDRMYAARAHAGLTADIFGPNATVIERNRKREIFDTEKDQFLRYITGWASKVSDPVLRNAIYARIVKRVSDAAFKTAHRPQKAFYGEGKHERNRLITVIASITYATVREETIGELVGGLEAHLQNLLLAKKNKNSGTSFGEREDIRHNVSKLAKKVQKQIVDELAKRKTPIANPDLLRRLKALTKA